MSYVEEKMEIKFPYQRETIMKYAIEVINNMEGFRIVEIDKNAFMITAKAGTTIWSWGENIIITIENDEPENKMVVSSSPRFGTSVKSDWGKNKKNINKIISSVSQLLSKITPDIKAAITTNIKTSIADEILKLKDLFDKDILTKEEFDEQKRRLLL